MTKLSIELKDSEFQRLLKTADKFGKSVQALIHEWINQMPELDKQETYDVTEDPVFLMEGYESNAPSDLSSNLDKYLYGDKYPK